MEMTGRFSASNWSRIPTQEVVSIVESGDRRRRIKAWGICAIGRFWGAISASEDVRTKCRDPGIGGIL